MYSWREVILLTSNLLFNADELILSMKQNLRDISYTEKIGALFSEINNVIKTKITDPAAVNMPFSLKMASVLTQLSGSLETPQRRNYWQDRTVVLAKSISKFYHWKYIINLSLINDQSESTLAPLYHKALGKKLESIIYKFGLLMECLNSDIYVSRNIRSELPNEIFNYFIITYDGQNV